MAAAVPAVELDVASPLFFPIAGAHLLLGALVVDVSSCEWRKEEDDEVEEEQEMACPSAFKELGIEIVAVDLGALMRGTYSSIHVSQIGRAHV